MVDNNDDIESEDDNDSADAAEAEGSPEEADTDNSPPDTDPLLASTPSPQSTPSSGADRRTDPSCRQRGGGVGESEVDNDVSLGVPKRSGGVDGGDDRDSGSSGGGSADATENTSDGVAVENRPPDRHSVYANANGGGGGGDGSVGADRETTNTPWTDIEWGQGEGESGGAVRRWGRAVQEGEEYGSAETFTSAGEVEPPPMTGEAVAGERRKEARESPSLDRGASRTDLTSEGGTHEAVQTATTPVKGVAGEPPPRSGGRSKKERRRASGSRAPKALVLSNGEWQTVCWSAKLGGYTSCRHTVCLACVRNFLSSTCGGARKVASYQQINKHRDLNQLSATNVKTSAQTGNGILAVPHARRFCLAAIKETVEKVAANGPSHGNGLVAEMATMPRGVHPTQRCR